MGFITGEETEVFIVLLPNLVSRSLLPATMATLTSRGFSCWDHLLAMAFAQLAYRESLRDIESCLRALQSKLYHMGFEKTTILRALRAADSDSDLFDIGNQPILFDF